MVDWSRIDPNSVGYQNAQLHPQGDFGSNPYGATNDYTQYAAQTRNPGLGAQQDALEMYRQQSLGNGPSVAQQQLQQDSAMQQRMALQAAGHAQGGNLAGAYTQALGSQAGIQAQTAQAQQLLRAQQMQAGMQGYAGLGSQIYQQGLGYNQLGMQQNTAGNQQMLDWYLGARGLDQQRQQMNRQFYTGLATAGAGLLGSAAGAGSTIWNNANKPEPQGQGQ